MRLGIFIVAFAATLSSAPAERTDVDDAGRPPMEPVGLAATAGFILTRDAFVSSDLVRRHEGVGAGEPLGLCYRIVGDGIDGRCRHRLDRLDGSGHRSLRCGR
jgi:hypothetical protein